MIKELIIILAAFFSLGVVGGLEKGMISIGGALLAWCAAAGVIGILVLTGRGKRNGKS